MRNGDNYMSHYNASVFGSWSAFFAGSFVGGALALLFAPQTGSELRGVLRTYAAKTKDQVVERGHKGRDTATQRGQETLQQEGQTAIGQVESGRVKLQEAGSGAAAQFTLSGHEATKKGQPV